MSSIPYMKFYPGDYLGDTQHLTTTQHGAYLLLIMAYWQKGGPLPADDKKLALIVRSSNDEWTEIKDEVLGFFEERDGALHHNRIDLELEKMVERSEKAKRSVEARERKKRKPKRSMNERSSNDERTTSDRSSNDEQSQSQMSEEPHKEALQTDSSDNETSRGAEASEPEEELDDIQFDEPGEKSSGQSVKSPELSSILSNAARAVEEAEPLISQGIRVGMARSREGPGK